MIQHSKEKLCPPKLTINLAGWAASSCNTQDHNPALSHKSNVTFMHTFGKRCNETSAAQFDDIQLTFKDLNFETKGQVNTLKWK